VNISIGGLFQSFAGHVAIIAFIGLLLLIPLALVQEVVHDRAERLDGVQRGIADTWGRPQSLSTPAVIVPVKLLDGGRSSDGSLPEVMVAILPAQASMDLDLNVEQRQRGIYSVPVYTATLKARANFKAGEVMQALRGNIEPQWSRAYVGLLVSDRRRAETGGWNATTALDAPDMAASLEKTGVFFDGQFVGRPLSEGDIAGLQKGDHVIALDVQLFGTKLVQVAPGTAHTTVSMAGNWPSPSFGGVLLPDKREVTPEKFSATWELKGVPAETVAPAVQLDQDQRAAPSMVYVSVQLNEPVSAYGKTGRVADYGILFIILTFTAYFVFEVMGRVSVHPVQYGLIGCALCLFYLLLLSTSEVIGFGAAYALSAAAIVTQMSLYTWGILGRNRGLTIAGLGTVLYALLYVLLEQEEFPLLAGAWALFVVLSAVMWLTRKLDWARPLKKA
jgi:inner membrane protein